MYRDLIKKSYDQIAEYYLTHRTELKSNKHVSQLLKLLPKQSQVLDLGCGAGVPIDDLILKAGHSVIGIDISPKQIELARKYCPRGQFITGDIAELRIAEYQVDAIISFYALFHLPRTQHAEILKTWSRNLSSGGLMLVSMGDREFEGNHSTLGIQLWSSQYGTKKNSQMVMNAGFDIIAEDIDTSGGERHQVILARKIS